MRTGALPLLGLLFLAATSLAGAEPPRRQVAVTFDDLPCNPQEGSTVERQVAINRAIVSALTAASIPAVGFVNEARVHGADGVDPGRVAALELWLEAGLELGNHTFSHPSLHRTPLDEYLSDVARGEPVVRGLLERRGRKLRWFRHPFLHTGLDLETRKAVEDFLAAREVRVAPVTIDNAEWIFARAWLRADEVGEAEAKTRITDAYLSYMEAKTDYWERQSVALFGREIPQVLLVHGNRLNANAFPGVIAMLANRGYRFVSLDAVLADPAYGSPDTFVGRGGISWLHRWALSRENRDALVPDEPSAPDWILAAAGVESE